MRHKQHKRDIMDADTITGAIIKAKPHQMSWALRVHQVAAAVLRWQQFPER